MIPLKLANFSINFVFQPMFGKTGELLAVECLSRITANNQGTAISPEFFFQNLTPGMSIDILKAQIALIESYREWFVSNDVIVTLNVDDKSLEFVNKHYLSRDKDALSFIHFEVNESSDSLVAEPNQSPVFLKKQTVWLDDFGSGLSGFSAFFDNQFRFIKIDRFLLWNFMSKPGGSQLMDALLNFFALNNCNVVVEGIETDHHEQWLSQMPYYALQGKLWKELTIEELCRAA
ncbi:EAL domain-containing protein [Tatumella sp. UBA2305]|uniref:EAL domain-containing protein n=1 Tax=Tatumella sp. UBA2305 TaxID=1947647 RepID=UPI0025E8C951|nr:EAL domain-containing protein [Tatumella sp. UBA2305]